jgi:multidrug efflux system membrane fusion protein
MHFTPLILSVVVALSVAGCSRPAALPEPIRSVKLMTVAASGVTARQELSGEVRARTESRLSFRVGGKLIERPAEVGQVVKAGQLLARLDASDLLLASQAAQAQVAAAQSQRDLAAADLKRFTDLKAQGFVSGAEIERRQATLQAAEATLRQARAQGAVQGHQADYTRLLADATGVVVSVEAEVGQVVAAGSPVVRIARDGARDVVFSIPESDLSLIKPGLKAQVRLWANTAQGMDTPLLGEVREVAASADPVTRTFLVKLALPVDAVAPLGATAYVVLPPASGDAPAVIKLPTSALMSANAADKTSSAVWVFDVATSTVQSRPVQVGGADGNEIVILSGLKPGDEVVVAGVHVLSPGQHVTRFAAAAR